MASSFIPDSEYIPDKTTGKPVRQAQRDEPIFIPDSQFKSDEDLLQEKHGDFGQQALAGAEGLARGASLGGSDYLLTKLGVSPKEIRGRQEANPFTSGLSNITGGAALVGLTGGLAAPIEGAIGAATTAGQIAARAAAMGAEGAAFGAGNTVSDAALGDTNINAQKIATDIGLGALLGSGLGVVSKGIEASPSLFRKAPKAIEEPLSDATSEPVVRDPDFNPSSIEEIAAGNKNAGYMGIPQELPQKAVLQDAASRLELQFPVHNLQLESLENQSSRDLYQAAKELSSKEGKELNQWEANQKHELNKITDRTINELHPKSEPLSDARENGQRAIDVFSEQYQAEKKALEPTFKALKTFSTVEPAIHEAGAIDSMTKAVPNLARAFDTTAEEIKLKPYKTTMGVDEATYKATKQAVDSLKEASTIEDLMNIRKGLSQNVDVLSQGSGPGEIRAMKAAMMDYIQQEVDKVAGEGFGVRDAFRRYAINEQQREVIEKAFGAKVGQEFGQISKVKNEKILDKMFSDTATVQAAKNILGPEKFNEMLSNYLAENRALNTQDGVFSSKKFGSFLSRKKDVLNEALNENPVVLQRLRDANTISRIIPDASSVNPSGTAKTLWGVLKAHSKTELLANAKEYGAEKLNQKLTIEKLNAHLSGEADKAEKLSIVKKIIDKASKKIDEETKGIFNNDTRRGIAINSAVSVSESEYNKRVNRIRLLAHDPRAMIDHLDDNTGPMYVAAPNVTQSLHNTIVAGVQFLNSKIPGPLSKMPLSGEYKPSSAQMLKFNNYYHYVSDPISALGDIKQGTLTNEAMEAIGAVHPQLLQEMKSKILQNFNPEKAMNLDYGAKLSLSKFLGEPLDENMVSQNIASYQASLSGPQLGQQSGQKPGKVTFGGLKELKIGGRSATETQALEASDVS